MTAFPISEATVPKLFEPWTDAVGTLSSSSKPASFIFWKNKSVELGSSTFSASSYFFKISSLNSKMFEINLIPLPQFVWLFFKIQYPSFALFRKAAKSGTESSLYVSGQNSSTERYEVKLPLARLHFTFSIVSRVDVLFVKHGMFGIWLTICLPEITFEKLISQRV